MSESPVFETHIQPRNHAVLIKPFPVATRYKGILHLPDQNKDASNSGIIIRTGNQVRSVQIGEWVIYNWRQAITVDGDFIVLDERALIAVLAEPKEVLISVGIAPCDAHIPCPDCGKLYNSLKEDKRLIVEVLEYKSTVRYARKFEAIVAVHTTSDFLLGYAYAYGIRIYPYYMYIDTLIPTMIGDLRPEREE